VAAVSELQDKYKSQINFTIIPAGETLRRTEEVNGFGFEALLHGMVAFNSEGEALVKMPGHAFGLEEIEAAVQKVLAAG
jgi:hypothetical protein